MELAGPGDAGPLGTVAPAAGGGAHVLLMPEDPAGGMRLLTVQRPDGVLRITDDVRVPLTSGVDLHARPDGSLVVVGSMPSTDDPYGEAGPGFAVVSPGTGPAEVSAAVPIDPSAEPHRAWGPTALSADGTVLYVVISGRTDRVDAASASLLAVGLPDGDLLARRRLQADTGSTATFPQLAMVSELSAGPGGDVAVVVDDPQDRCWERNRPVLLRYAARLEPAEPPVRLLEPATALWPTGAVHGSDGTLFVALEGSSGQQVVAVPEGSDRVTRLSAGSDSSDRGGLLVDPGQRWALVPDHEGARSIGLAGGRDRRVVIPCLEGSDGMVGTSQEVGVHDVAPGSDPSEVFLVGQCENGFGAAMLWVLGS